MPQAANIVLNDATPLARTFEPSVTPQGKSVFLDADSITGAGNNQLILGMSPARPGRPTYRTSKRINMPVEQTVDGVTTVAYTLRHIVSNVIPEQATATERADFQALIENSEANAVIAGYVTDLTNVY